MTPITLDFTGIVKFSMNTSKKNNYCIVIFIYIFIIQYAVAFSETHVIIEVKAAEKTMFQRMTAGHLIETAVYAKFFGKLHNIGRENNVEGRIHLLPNNCDKDEQSFARLPGGWVAVLNYTGKPGTSRESGNVKECQGVVERMKKVLIFGASAIIILTLNNQILEQLDIGQLFSKPVVLIDTVENISAILQFLSSKMKLRAKFAFNVTNIIPESQKFFTTVTLWGTCGRYSGQSYHEWDGVVCLGQPHSLTYKEGKVDPENFWNYFYTGILLLLMVHYIRTRRGPDWENPDYIDVGLSQLAYKALAVMKIQRYSKDDRIDTCAICLEKFFTKQKLRVLPCRHYFHTKCVDPWLVRSHTCPLCKLNIIETLECHPEED